MGNYTNFLVSENPRRGGQARNFTTNVPKILDLKSSSEQIFSENCIWVPLFKERNLSTVNDKRTENLFTGYKFTFAISNLKISNLKIFILTR